MGDNNTFRAGENDSKCLAHRKYASQAKGKKGHAKGSDTFPSLLPDSTRAVEVKKHGAQVDDATGKAQRSLCHPSSGSVPEETPAFSCTDAPPAAPLSGDACRREARPGPRGDC
ncbi:unnamed protein product [Rangifer tarandus platyrhynchus]|uniref:Uncharacterized protein n=1 Tax=Rangifer tarandus platyrhynchus TaxID=3082113 RepID=A0ABN8XZR3_RANTA|nr:unnamed protein product [Rangifer tarandus platyrhynchus]